jgi:pimeloyl-ACP methyl ester carboxylesterase
VANLCFTATSENCRGDPYENVIFLHGFMCSSSFWTQTLFPCFSENVNHDYRLIAIDLLGFGKSPKPRDCLYTLKDHVEMIEKSVIQPLHLGTFHLVAHSMGSVIALALAAKYHNCVKSITLVAPVSTLDLNYILFSCFKKLN